MIDKYFGIDDVIPMLHPKNISEDQDPSIGIGENELMRELLGAGSEEYRTSRGLPEYNPNAVRNPRDIRQVQAGPQGNEQAFEAYNQSIKPGQGQGTPADLDQHKADQLDFPNAAQEVLSNAGGPVVKGAQKLFKLFTQGKKASKGVAQVFKDRAAAKQKPLQIEDKRQVPLQTEKPKVEIPIKDDEIPF
jgi:hypothetical protein